MVSVACSDDIKQKIRFGNGYEWENVTQRRLISTPHRFSEHKPFINGNFQNRCNDDELQVLPWKFWDVRSVNQGGKVEDTAHTSPEIFRPRDHRDEIWNYVVRCSLQQDAVFSHCSYFNHCHEHLFYKIVTPSDVGKLNRLVIPKHHAEQCFPLELTQRKRGLLLTFRDDATGKLWWFRYSYWSSSQSYVLTKGWSRFVKEKRLLAGDIISFAKGSREEFYITSCKQKPFRSPTVRQGLQTKPVDQSFTDLVKHAHLGAYYDSCQKGSDKLQLLLPSEEPSSSSKAVAAELSDHKTPVVQNEDMHVLDCRTADPLNSFSNLRLFGVDLCSSFASSN